MIVSVCVSSALEKEVLAGFIQNVELEHPERPFFRRVIKTQVKLLVLLMGVRQQSTWSLALLVSKLFLHRNKFR